MFLVFYCHRKHKGYHDNAGIEDKWEKLTEPRRRKFLKIIQEIMEKEDVDEEVTFCEMSIMSPCRAL
ncbi:MAG: CerR family C-terminal domain-containing protein [Deltaproteobacteria bacterium]|nr:CerR family C-terminal domain-containing protein [Deltaproteobacteria bacterium]MBW1933162.1 CerR family C-terminal domain-containing protein [Deltaproteobacteria bacterium]MBW1979457.1 CerR family C-terminal domain-containing protein [Deltaproteobacteria bacterium]